MHNVIKRRGGFTLIELLVVIAIIAILAAILFPVFAKVREKARQTMCLSNEKQIGLGIAQYTEDNDETFPGHMYSYSWASQVLPFIKSSAVFTCPDDTEPIRVSSYGANKNIGEYAGGPPGFGAHTLSEFSAPARTVLLFELMNGAGDISDPANDGSSTGFGVGGDYDPNGYDNEVMAGATPNDGKLKFATGWLRYSLQNGQFNAKDGRHTGGANYLMADYHAKFFRPNAVTAGLSNGTSGDCGTANSDPALVRAANTECSDGTVAATFSVN